MSHAAWIPAVVDRHCRDAVSLLFAGALWWCLDGSVGREVANTKALEFITGYLIEKSLAVDNGFVWLMLFSFFAIPPELQKRVLIYGVRGAIVLRTAMILAGAWLITQFHWILLFFGAFLLITGIKMWWFADEKPDLDKNPVVKSLRVHMNITPELYGERFFVIRGQAGKLVRYATSLFVVLVLVEITDLIFAVGSIPAILAITTDPFIVRTSNVFAIIGLRAMYFLLADVADRFSLLKYGLALVLMFVGVKMLLIDVYKIPIGVSLAVVALIIGVAVWLSLLQRWSGGAFRRLAAIARPRWIAFTGRGARIVNGAFLAIAGLALIAPVPLVSFDNVLPAAAVVLLAWGLRLRDGALLATGYAATVVAVGSVVLLWWGGAELVRWLFASIQ